MLVEKNPFTVFGRSAAFQPDSNVDAGWSSPVARQAHNLKVVGSNPTPATNKTHHIKYFAIAPFGELFAFLATVDCRLDGIGMPKSGI